MTDSGEAEELLARLRQSPGLCAGCRHRRLQVSRRSVFVRCGLSGDESGFPRYPSLPVLACRGYEPADRADRLEGD